MLTLAATVAILESAARAGNAELTILHPQRVCDAIQVAGR